VTDVVDRAGAFVPAPLGSIWSFDAERVKLTGIAVWSERRASRRHGRTRVALALFAGGDAERLVRWTSVEPPRGTPVRPFRYVDTLEATAPPWDGAVRDAIAADRTTDWDAAELPVVVDWTGARWECEVLRVAQLERHDGALPMDPAAVAAFVQVDADAPADVAPDSVVMLADSAGRSLRSYTVHAHDFDEDQPGLDRRLLLMQHLRITAIVMAIGILAILVIRLV